MVRRVHRTKPRYFVRSLKHWLGVRNSPGSRISFAILTSRPGAGALKLLLEILLALARLLRRGEAVRYFNPAGARLMPGLGNTKRPLI